MTRMIRSGWLLALCLAWGCTSHKLSDTPSPAVGDTPAPAIDMVADLETKNREVAPDPASEPEGLTTSEPAATSQPVTVTDADFEEKVLRSSLPVMVDFWAGWCGPCLALAPTIDKLAAEYQGRVVVAKLDTDANPQMSAKYEIDALPTMILFKDGRPVDKIVGGRPKAELARALDSLLGG